MPNLPRAIYHWCVSSPACITSSHQQRGHIGDVDPRIVHDRPQLHISPSIRMVHLDLSAPKDTSIAHCARYNAEIMSLRAGCIILQWRSGVHSATIAGLTCLTRMVRDQAIQMKDERDSFEQRYNALKRKVRDEDEQ